MKKLLIILLLFPLQAYVQDMKLEYSMGYGTYKLKDIVNLQKSMDSEYGLKITDCFPAYINHSALLGYSTGVEDFGVNFTYLTTGGRLHNADYSGSYSIDMILNGYRLGAFYRYYIDPEKSTNIFVQISSGVIFSKLKIKEHLIIYNDSEIKNTELEGAGMYIEPTIGATYPIKRDLHFSASLGYEFDFLGKLKLLNQDTHWSANWNGLRIYAGFIFTIPTQNFIE